MNLKLELLKILSEVSWGKVITSIIAFFLGWIIKSFLDHNYALWIVKRLNNTPVRFIYRTNPIKLSGDWEQIWDFSSRTDPNSKYGNTIDRHSHTELKQLGSYVYAEFYSKDDKYYFFGEIKGNYIVGHWGDLKDKEGYFGSFELRIVNSKSMIGKWIGHSKSEQDIFGDKWTWSKKN